MLLQEHRPVESQFHTQIMSHLNASPQMLGVEDKAGREPPDLYFRLQERKQKTLFIWAPQLAN
jgi:hypothetical protein